MVLPVFASYLLFKAGIPRVLENVGMRLGWCMPMRQDSCSDRSCSSWSQVSVSWFAKPRGSNGQAPGVTTRSRGIASRRHVPACRRGRRAIGATARQVNAGERTKLRSAIARRPQGRRRRGAVRSRRTRPVARLAAAGPRLSRRGDAQRRRVRRRHRRPPGRFWLLVPASVAGGIDRRRRPGPGLPACVTMRSNRCRLARSVRGMMASTHSRRDGSAWPSHEHPALPQGRLARIREIHDPRAWTNCAGRTRSRRSAAGGDGGKGRAVRPRDPRRGKDGRVHGFVAYGHGELVGCTWIRPHTARASARSWPARRSQAARIGSSVEVLQGNDAALRFYQSIGFVEPASPAAACRAMRVFRHRASPALRQRCLKVCPGRTALHGGGMRMALRWRMSPAALRVPSSGCHARTVRTRRRRSSCSLRKHGGTAVIHEKCGVSPAQWFARDASRGRGPDAGRGRNRGTGKAGSCTGSRPATDIAVSRVQRQPDQQNSLLGRDCFSSRWSSERDGAWQREGEEPWPCGERLGASRAGRLRYARYIAVRARRPPVRSTTDARRIGQRGRPCNASPESAGSSSRRRTRKALGAWYRDRPASTWPTGAGDFPVGGGAGSEAGMTIWSPFAQDTKKCNRQRFLHAQLPRRRPDALFAALRAEGCDVMDEVEASSSASSAG